VNCDVVNCAHATRRDDIGVLRAHGDQIAHRVAERLALHLWTAPFRLVVQQLTPSGEVEESLDEPAPRRWNASSWDSPTRPRRWAEPVATAEIETPERFRKANEAKLRDIADTTGE